MSDKALLAMTQNKSFRKFAKALSLRGMPLLTSKGMSDLIEEIKPL
jgi:hypothetical protein